MGNVADWMRLAIPAAVAVLLFVKHREVREAIERFRNNFPRGGPPTPMHPSPAADYRAPSRRARTDQHECTPVRMPALTPELRARVIPLHHVSQ